MADNEAPEPDVAEQRRPVTSADDEPDAVELAARNRPIDVDPADLLEQLEELPVEDDDRR
jgi:hypothetical protein